MYTMCLRERGTKKQVKIYFTLILRSIRNGTSQGYEIPIPISTPNPNPSPPPTPTSTPPRVDI